jgi:Phospholipase B
MTTLMRCVSVGVAVWGVLAAAARAAGPDPSASSAIFRPDPATIERYGRGYRYPQAGWIVLHIEGEPYERGYQHGRLLAPEIARFVRELAAYRSTVAPGDAWRDLRLLADALFLRRFDAEFLEEMKGIADGAAAAGARFQDRPVDLLDIATINADVETNFLADALEATPTGLEGRRFPEPLEKAARPRQETHCSAFAATAPATAGGQVVIGHITMWNLFHSFFYNVWLDVKPARGHRVLMQTYPAGIMSGLDYYQNDRGLVVCETTLAQTKFDATGIPLVDRIRRALQYADSIEGAVEILRQGNNGLYTNEWLLADTKVNEIAMFELGTHKSRLWRSSKQEWFGGTAGFYWGCNNAKDLQVRLETVPALDGRPANVVFHPSDRDRLWLELFDRKKPAINVEFGFTAFTTPPLAAAHSLDAKFTTTALAQDLAAWARFGPPLGRTWEPAESERLRHPSIRPLVGNDWTILRVAAPTGDQVPAVSKPVDLARLTPAETERAAGEHRPAWHGTVLPETAADTWLAAAFADYERIVAEEKAVRARSRGALPGKRDQEGLALALFGPTSQYLAAVARRGGKDVPLAEIRPDLRSDEWYDISAGKGVLILCELRKLFEPDKFETFMDAFGRAHAGGPVSSASFFTEAEKALGKSIGEMRTVWLNGDALRSLSADTKARHASGRFWSVASFERQLDETVIVYGTLAEADAQREAAHALQQKIASRWSNVFLPVKADNEVSDSLLKESHVLLVGRPATNRVTARFTSALPVRFGPASFAVAGETFAHSDTAVVAAGPNPLAAGRSVVVFAGLSAQSTWLCPRRYEEGERQAAEVLILESDRPARGLAVAAEGKARGVAAAQGSPPAGPGE